MYSVQNTILETLMFENISQEIYLKLNMITAKCGNNQWDPISSLCTQLHLLSYYNKFWNEKYIGKVWDIRDK